MALGTTASMLKAPTALQLLLEEINFQRTKEMRQLLKDDGGFVVLQGTTYWTDLFVRHFLFQTEPVHSIDCDDLLFFVRKKHVKGSSRIMPKYDTEVEVFRKDSRKLPIGDPDVDWEETVYLNLVIHQFDYTLTLAICTRTSPKELQVLRRHSQKVYASPSRRKMDSKGDSEEITYPHICFMVDNFDEVFHDILVRDGEMVCVELVASDRDGSVQGVIFLGSIRYDALKKVYDARQSSLSSKVAQRMSFGLFSSGGPQTRCEFVRMKGPQGKGHAEMAVTKPKGSGVETPTSEPGFCATDMWDSDWEEDVDEYNYRHQRRLSDPSSNLNNFSRNGWRTKNPTDTYSSSNKARSENEGLDCLANEVSEIEAGDLRDDRPASSASDSILSTSTRRHSIKSPTATTTCCNCFGPKKRWSDITGTSTSSSQQQMSEIYCQTCDDKNNSYDLNSPACLINISNKRVKQKHRNVLNVESEIEFGSGKNSSNSNNNSGSNNNNSKSKVLKNKKLISSPKKDKCKSSPKKDSVGSSTSTKNNNSICDDKKLEEYELADDATSLNGCDMTDESGVVKIGLLNDIDTKLMIRVNGKEEFPVVEANSSNSSNSNKSNSSSNKDKFIEFLRVSKKSKNKKYDIPVFNKSNDNNTSKSNNNCNNSNLISEDDCNGNNKDIQADRTEEQQKDQQRSTLPKIKKSMNPNNFVLNRTMKILPKRRTADGTNIYYWCDISKKKFKELDDGAYNPLWTTRGFTQTFHFWKENRRQQSTPLNAFLTYVTLPWWSIAKDLLDHREEPILTF